MNKTCQYCGKEFEARTTVTKTCSDPCAKMLYKKRQREMKIERTKAETQRIRNKPIEDLKAKEFLTVREVAALLNCSIRSVYNHIENKRLKAVNLSQRLTRVKRSDLDRLFI
jgi:excisionase family DNA binding protein